MFVLTPTPRFSSCENDNMAPAQLHSPLCDPQTYADVRRCGSAELVLLEKSEAVVGKQTHTWVKFLPRPPSKLVGVSSHSFTLLECDETTERPSSPSHQSSFQKTKNCPPLFTYNSSEHYRKSQRAEQNEGEKRGNRIRHISIFRDSCREIVIVVAQVRLRDLYFLGPKILGWITSIISCMYGTSTMGSKIPGQWPTRLYPSFLPFLLPSMVKPDDRASHDGGTRWTFHVLASLDEVHR